MEYKIKQKKSGCLSLINSENKECKCKDIIEKFGSNKIFAFQGKMGAGKTTFIKQLCKEIGTDDIVNSPTFAIVNVYETRNNEIYHFDCYRLKSLQEAIDLGAEEYLYSGNYCFIEWPDVISNILPENTIEVKIEVKGNGERILSISEEPIR